MHRLREEKVNSLTQDNFPFIIPLPKSERIVLESFICPSISLSQNIHVSSYLLVSFDAFLLKMDLDARKCVFGITKAHKGVQWLSGRVLTRDQEPVGSSLAGVAALCPWARYINPSLELVQPSKTSPYITERLLMGRKESNQTNKQSNKGTEQSAHLHCMISTYVFHYLQNILS